VVVGGGVVVDERKAHGSPMSMAASSSGVISRKTETRNQHCFSLILVDTFLAKQNKQFNPLKSKKALSKKVWLKILT
jgi:hypothetical protein